jgi:hypothetical protein
LRFQPFLEGHVPSRGVPQEFSNSLSDFQEKRNAGKATSSSLRVVRVVGGTRIFPGARVSKSTAFLEVFCNDKAKRMPALSPVAGLALPANSGHRLNMTTMTLEQAQSDLGRAVQRALQGETVLITVGDEAVQLKRDIPLRPPGYFAACYGDPEDAAFEERICHDSRPVLEA